MIFRMKADVYFVSEYKRYQTNKTLYFARR